MQVATRFTVAKECGLPEDVKQEYFRATENDIEVNQVSPTGYPMRMLKGSPAIGAGIRPNEKPTGICSMPTAAARTSIPSIAKRRRIPKRGGCRSWTKPVCAQMRNFDLWTCGHYTYRLKDTTNKLEDGSYQIPTAEHISRTISTVPIIGSHCRSDF